MNELENIAFKIGMNPETAAWVNFQHERIGRGTRLLVDIALSIGEALSIAAGNFPAGNFPEWLEREISCPKTTAYRCMSLFNYKEQIAAAGSLAEAYKQIESLEARKKQSETQKAYQRVAEYRKTGVKPDGWRQHTDDKLAQEEAERDERIGAVKQAAEDRNAAKKQEQAAWDERRAEAKRIVEEAEAETELLTGLLTKTAEEGRKRAEFKEQIRLSAEGMKDPFQDAIIDYLDSLEDDNRRIEACYNIIKICKGIAVALQAERG
jgi:hypothetical protein